MQKKTLLLILVGLFSISSLVYADNITGYLSYKEQRIYPYSCDNESYISGYNIAEQTTEEEDGTTLVRTYIEWYRNGNFVGSDTDSDTTFPFETRAQTQSCTHELGPNYRMPWSIHVEEDDAPDMDLSGVEYS